jgi:hypothetical protein
MVELDIKVSARSDEVCQHRGDGNESGSMDATNDHLPLPHIHSLSQFLLDASSCFLVLVSRVAGGVVLRR